MGSIVRMRVEQKMSDTSITAAALLPWGQPKLVQTRRGPRLLATAPAPADFIERYKADEVTMRSIGVTIRYRYQGGAAEACWWRVPLQDTVKVANGFATGTTPTLRGYQEGAVEAGVRFMLEDGNENGIIIIPTGGGKSLCIGATAQRLPGPCLILQPSREILQQNAEKLRGYGYHPALYSASVGKKQVGDITLATIGSIIRKKDLFKDFPFCIIDEAHLVNAKGGMYDDFLASNKMRTVGYTATAYRLSTDGYGGSILKLLTRTRPRLFHRILYYCQNRHRFDAGYLCPLEYRVIKAVDTEQLTLNSTGADFTDASVTREFARIQFPELLYHTVKDLLNEGRKSIIVFTRFVAEAESLAARVPGAECVSAETPPKERARMLDAFKAGKIPFISNVGVVALGFDYPALDTVVLAGPTMSLAQYYQRVGRCIRPHPSKQSALVIDMVGLVKRFGKIEDLEIHEGEHGKWWIGSGNRPLTNVYFGTPHGRPDWIPEKSANSTIKGNLLPTLY